MIASELLQAGVDEFTRVFDAKLNETEGVIRSGGKPTKAYPNGVDEAWWRANAPAMIQSWITWRQQNPNLHLWKTPDGQPAIELKVVSTIEVDGELVDLVGYIDRVFADAGANSLLIVDLKTGKNAPMPLQLAFYRRALKATLGVDASYGAYWMARTGSLSPIHNLDQYSDDMIDHWVRLTYRGIRDQIFLPHLTNMCNYCGVKKHCYVWNPESRFSPLMLASHNQTVEGGSNV